MFNQSSLDWVKMKVIDYYHFFLLSFDSNLSMLLYEILFLYFAFTFLFFARDLWLVITPTRGEEFILVAEFHLTFLTSCLFHFFVFL